MKRALTALLVTVAGVAWLVTFKVTPHARPVAAAGETGSPPPATPPAPPSPAPTGAAPTPAPTPANRAASGTFTGSAVATIYGDVQVRITVSGGHVTNVTSVQMPVDRARSAEITQFVDPILRSEAISAQSARIDIISGATFTSEAYAMSLEDALRQDHLG